MTEKLFNDFPPVSTRQWEEQIHKDLKGADYDRKLVWRTSEGFSVRPYFRDEDLKEIPYLDTVPGQHPFLRGTRPDNNWLIRQGFTVKGSLERLNERVLNALDRGVESIGFRLDKKKDYAEKDLEVILKGVFLPAVEISFEGVSCEKPQVLNAFLNYIKTKCIDPFQVRARFEFNPLGEAYSCGQNPSGESLDVLKTLIENCSEYPHIRVTCIRGYDYRNNGSGIVQELAFSMAMGNEYIRILKEKGMDQSMAIRSIHFHTGIGSHYFLEIAKFRAARVFWSRIAEEQGIKEPEDQKIRLHATTNFWNQTAYDMYVNLLRGTTQAMSAAIAGVDSLEVTPFDRVIREGNDFSDRLARNIQIILKEEAHFERVTDPAAGSYYVENLTKSILAESEKIYHQLMEKGGFSSKTGREWVSETIRDARERSLKSLASRKEILVGINQYSDSGVKAPKELSEATAEQWMRAAAPFEKLRLQTDKAFKTPQVFLLTFGNLAMCRARAQFSANFFGVAGYRIIDNNHFASLEEGIQAAVRSGARIVVACSSDEEYCGAVPLIARTLGDNIILTVAGDPACKEELIKEGVTHFISLRSNVLETLLQYHKEMEL
ncbi:MAG: methylmalonyl-CoA mutase family protein [Bacteroidales bacterium]|jgi:methylmalonyl-CoA mutase